MKRVSSTEQLTSLVLLALTVAMTAWLLMRPQPETLPTVDDYSEVADSIIAQGNAAMRAYSPNSGADTGVIFSGIYFDVFEGSGMEMAIGNRDIAIKAELENYFSTIISLAMRGAHSSELEQSWHTLRARLLEEAPRYHRTADHPAIKP